MITGRASLFTFPDVTKWWLTFKSDIKRFPWEGIKPTALKSKIASEMFKGIQRLRNPIENLEAEIHTENMGSIKTTCRRGVGKTGKDEKSAQISKVRGKISRMGCVLPRHSLTQGDNNNRQS